MFVAGSLLLVFAVLVAQTPTKDHSFDVLLFASSGGLLLAALVLGILGLPVVGTVQSSWAKRLAAIICLGSELLVCLVGLVDSLKHMHSL
jgi:hypothetical protein